MFLRISAFLALIISFSSCSTDLDLTAEWEEVTIVYALLNTTDSAHFVRISKAFLDKETSALKLAQIGDSLYHQQPLTAIVEEVNQGNVTNSWPLTQIDGDTSGLPKSPGIFATNPNTLYTFQAPLQVDEDIVYRVRINGPINGEVSAETPIIGEITNVLPNKIIPLNWAIEGDYLIRFKGTEGMALYDLVLRFHWSEYNRSDNSYIGSEYIDWPIVTGRTVDQTNLSQQFKVPGKNLYAYVNSRLTSNNNIYRVIDSFDIQYYIGEQQLGTYIEVVQAQFGLTQTQIKPNWTNVNNGIGLFSSRYDTTVSGIPFTDAALDSFSCGAITGHLNFAPSPGSATWPFCQ
jgi:hypothetical protein